MKFFILFALSCVLLANVISATSDHHQKYKLTRITREADDDDEVDDPEIEASMKRRPKITRPSFSSGPKTTKKPDESAEAEKVDQPTAAPAAADEEKQPAVESKLPVDSPRSFVEPRPLPPFRPLSPPPQSRFQPVQPQPQPQPQPAAPLYTGFQGNQFVRPYQADSSAAAQWGVKGGRSSKSSAFWLGKGVGGQQQQLQQQAIVKSPIARGKSMYSPRPQVPMVVAPLPQTDLQVPAALPVENSVQQSLQQQQQQQWKPQQRQEPQQQVGSRYQEGGNQVNSYSQSQSPVYQPVPPPAPVNPVMPIARGSRPRSSKSKYVDVDEYQQREELNPVSSRPQPLARAAVSEGAFAMDCPYGMRLSMCRLRAAQRLRS